MCYAILGVSYAYQCKSIGFMHIFKYMSSSLTQNSTSLLLIKSILTQYLSSCVFLNKKHVCLMVNIKTLAVILLVHEWHIKFIRKNVLYAAGQHAHSKSSSFLLTRGFQLSFMMCGIYTYHKSETDMQISIHLYETPHN